MDSPQAVSFDYSPGHISALEADLSIERLAPYVAKSGGDKGKAIRLYERNTRLCEALFGPLQHVEVVFRNAFEVQLAKLYGKQWFHELRQRNLLILEHSQKIAKAIEYLERAKKPVTAARMVSELSFGFWVGICASRYQNTLWMLCLHRPFKQAGPKGKALSRSTVFLRLDHIRLLRNRVAHHQPILDRDLETDFALILETVGWISCNSAAWMASTSCFQERFGEPDSNAP